jgi:hypothetical protein
MKNKFKISTLLVLALLALNISVAKADPTYAVLDANGNVTNIIVCGSACASGEFDGNKVVLQIAADPITNENRGGFWLGPGSTTYDQNSEVFTVMDNTAITNSTSEQENGTTVVSSATVYGGKTTQFKYTDTIGDNLFTRNGFVYGYSDQTKAIISVNKNNVTESIVFSDRKNTNEIQESIQNSNLLLLNSKIQQLITLLGGWVK